MKEEVVQAVSIEIPEAEENKEEEVENLLHDSPTTAILDDQSTAPSTQVATDDKSTNKYELLEHFLSFIDTEEELNPVLCGYFAKLFQVLVSSHAKEVFGYVYSHTVVLDNLVRHSYQKSISDVLIRLMNTQENLFQGENDILQLSYHDINTLRCSYVLKIIQKLAPETTYEDQLNSQQILCDIADYKLLYTEMLSEGAFELYKGYLKSESDSSKSNVYILLSLLLQKYHSHMEESGNKSSSYDYLDEEDEESSKTVNVAKPDARIV